MAIVTTRHLATLATKATGKPCKVEIGHDLPNNVAGLATHDGAQYVILIHPIDLAMRDVKQVAHTFWHECGHIACGHVPESKATITRAMLEIEVTERQADSGGAHVIRERQADEWAAKVRAVIPDSEVWDLITAG